MNTVLSRIFTIIFVQILWLACPAHAQKSPQAIFDNANEQLENGNYQNAISLYKNIESRNSVSGALYLNLGIAYHRVDSLGRAKYYLLKASQFDNTEERADKALSNLESQFSRQSAVLPKLPWDRATDWLRAHIGATNLMIIGIILLNISILIYVLHWFVHWRPKMLSMSGLSLLILALLIISASFYTDYIGNRYSKAVMVMEKSAVVEQPQSQAPIVSQAYEGYTFTVDHYRSKSQSNWVYVRLSNGQYGWIPKSEILIL